MGKCLSSPDRTRPILQVSFVAEPVDWLWQRLQHLDDNSQSLIDACSQKRSPFIAAARRSSDMLLQPEDESALAPLLLHALYGTTAAEQDSFRSELRTMIASVVTQLYWRFILMFKCWPFPLVCLADQSLTENDWLDVVRKLYQADECCLDWDCARKMRAQFQTMMAFYNDAELRRLIWTWARKAKLCNMHLERVLALIRSSAPRRLPNAERLCAGGLLAMINQKHKAAGGTAAGSLRRKQALAEGVPLASRPREAKPNPGRARGHFAYMAQKLSENRGLSREGLNQLRRDACQEFRQLSFDRRLEFSDEARQKAKARVKLDDHTMSRYNLDGELLWGLSREDTPFDEEAFEAVIAETFGLDQVLPLVVVVGNFNRRSDVVVAVVESLRLVPRELSMWVVK